MTDYSVRFESVLKAIKDKKLKSLLEQFYSSTKTASSFRNSLTHRFPINQKDFRTELKFNQDGNKQLSIKGGGKKIESNEMLLNINEISHELSALLMELKNIFENKTTEAQQLTSGNEEF